MDLTDYCFSQIIKLKKTFSFEGIFRTDPMKVHRFSAPLDNITVASHPPGIRIVATKKGQGVRDMYADLRHLKQTYNITSIVTLSTESELKFYRIKKAELLFLAQEVGIEWIYCPLQSTFIKCEDTSIMDNLIVIINRLKKAVDDSETILVHCNADFRRTSALLCALLAIKFPNFNIKDSFKKITPKEVLSAAPSSSVHNNRAFNGNNNNNNSHNLLGSSNNNLLTKNQLQRLSIFVHNFKHAYREFQRKIEAQINNNDTTSDSSNSYRRFSNSFSFNTSCSLLPSLDVTANNLQDSFLLNKRVAIKAKGRNSYRFLIGNTCTILGKQLKQEHGGKYQWTAFVHNIRNMQNIPFVRMVEFTLHNKFPPEVIACPTCPFEITRYTNTTFVIEIKIHFKRASIPPKVVEHELCFTNGGIATTEYIFFDDALRREWKEQRKSMGTLQALKNSWAAIKQENAYDLLTKPRTLPNIDTPTNTRRERANAKAEFTNAASYVANESSSWPRQNSNTNKNDSLQYDSLEDVNIVHRQAQQTSNSGYGSLSSENSPNMSMGRGSPTMRRFQPFYFQPTPEALQLEIESASRELSNAELTDLKNWLADINCEQYFNLFKECNLSFDLLPCLSRADFKELGVLDDSAIDRIVEARNELERVFDSIKNEEVDMKTKVRYHEIQFKEINLKPKPLGQGAFGVVYLGTWRGATVAVKRLVMSLEEDKLEEFRREAALMEKLSNHPHICKFVGICTHPSNLCLVTQYCERGSAYDLLIKEQLNISWKNVVKFARDGAAGVYHLHREKVIHRDIAARNLLVATDWSACISDFGLSRIKKKSLATSEQAIDGPIRWMAPELLLDKHNYSEASDAYSFGIMMWELVAHRKPYSHLERRDVKMEVLSNDIRPKIPVDCPHAYSSIMQECWQRDAKQRPHFGQILWKLESYYKSLENC